MTTVSFMSNGGLPAIVSVGGSGAQSKLGMLADKQIDIFGSSSSNIMNPFSGASNDAVAKINDIIAGMEKAGSSNSRGAIENSNHNQERFERAARDASWTKESVVEWIKDENWGTEGSGRSKAESIIRDAIISGKATITDAEEWGYQTEISVNLHYSGDGEYTGGSADYLRRDPAGSKGSLMEDRLELDENGSFVIDENGLYTDKETGDYGTVITNGAVELYITWPKE